MAKFNSAFARQLENTPVRGAGGVEKPIRDWLNPADDDFSEALITPAGGDTARALADWASGIVTTDSTTARTLSAADHGVILNFTNGSAIAVTVPSGLPAGFTCGILQGGAGQITVTPSGTTVREPDSQLKTAQQWVILSLLMIATNEFVLSGRTAP